MIVIPMAGRSQRFFDVGYAIPKFRLPLDGKSVFAHAVESFRKAFADQPFLFIVSDPPAAQFVATETERLQIADDATSKLAIACVL